MPKAPELTEDQKRQVAETLTRWASLHPHADEPLIVLPGMGRTLSPREMAEAAHQPDTKMGQLVYRLFAIGIMPDEVEPPETLDQILADFRKDADMWAAEKSSASKPKKPGGPKV